MTYSQQTWADGEAGGTPLSAERLNHMEAGIAAAGAVESVNGEVGAVTLTAAEVGAVPADQVPSLDEICTGYLLPSVVSSAISFPIFGAAFPLTVEAFSTTQWGSGGVPASDSSYWTVELRRCRGLTLTTSQTDVIATRTTKVTASGGDPGGAMPYRGDWNFDAATFDPANKVLQKGDIVSVAFIPTGTPANISFPGGYLRYVPA